MNEKLDRISYAVTGDEIEVAFYFTGGGAAVSFTKGMDAFAVAKKLEDTAWMIRKGVTAREPKMASSMPACPTCQKAENVYKEKSSRHADYPQYFCVSCDTPFFARVTQYDGVAYLR